MFETMHQMAINQTTTPHIAGTEHILNEMHSIYQIRHYSSENRDQAWLLATKHSLNTDFATYSTETTPAELLSAFDQL